MSNTVTKKSKKNLAQIFNIVCAAAMAVFLLCMMLLPWRTFMKEELVDAAADPIVYEDTISLGEYVWLTEENEDLFGGNWKRPVDPATGEEITQNQIVVMPFICTLMVIAGMIFCLWKSDRTWTCVFPLVVGGYGTFAFLTTPVLKGDSWLVLVILSAVTLVVSLPLVFLWAKKVFKWFTVKK